MKKNKLPSVSHVLRKQSKMKSKLPKQSKKSKSPKTISDIEINKMVDDIIKQYGYVKSNQSDEELLKDIEEYINNAEKTKSPIKSIKKTKSPIKSKKSKSPESNKSKSPIKSKKSKSPESNKSKSPKQSKKRQCIYCGNNQKSPQLIQNGGDCVLGTNWLCLRKGIGHGLHSPIDLEFLNYEPIDPPEKIYCGNPPLPDRYERFARRHNCLQKGIGIGKRIRLQREGLI